MSSTASASTIHSIIDAALADYTKLTGTDLSKTPFAIALEQSNSLEAVLQLLHEREKAFKEYRDDDRKLIKCLGPAVKVVQAFSDVIGKAVGQVKPYMPSGGCLLTVTLSDPLPTIKRLICRDWHSS
jgi:fungal STAND N-terminal Goodbye domain